MADTVIAERPPRDGREWDAQCARCGSGVERLDCEDCNGEGEYEVEGMFGEFTGAPCETCNRVGGWYVCASSEEWCRAHPMAGREHVERDALEWFVTYDPGHE